MAAQSKKGPLLGQRHLQSFLLFLAIVVNFVSKYNVAVAVVAMTNSATTNPDFDEYDWNEKQKSYILSSFYWGYLLAQFPGGYICRRFGVKRTLLAATFLSSGVGIITPFCTPWGGWQVYCAIRVLQGIFQGPLLSCVQAHLAAWCPIKERNRLGAFANSGIECGLVVSMYMSGAISASAMGWPGISYMSGAVGWFWCIFWFIWGSNCPTKSKFISTQERIYIVASKSGQKEMVEFVPMRKIPVPWKAILSSVPFWAVIVARSGEAWGFSTTQAEIPTYMNGVLYMDMSENAFFSALPYVAMWIMSYVFLITSDILLTRKILSLTIIRKSFNTIAFWGPALGLVGIGFLGEAQKTGAIVLMTVIVGLNGGNSIGSLLNPIDLSPNHAVIVMSVVNFAAGVVTMFTPLLVGIIVHDVHDRTQWQIIFIIAAGMFFVSNLIYLIFGSTKLQHWDHEHFIKKRDNEANPQKEIDTKEEYPKEINAKELEANIEDPAKEIDDKAAKY